LASLDIKIVELQDNIVKLNQYVKTQTMGLEARGEQSNNLLVNHFKAYKACGNEEFVWWIGSKEDSYFEGALTLTPLMIMSWADNKYKMQKEARRWMQTSSAQKRIVALSTQVALLQVKPKPKKVTFDKRSHKKVGPPKAKDKDWALTLIGPKAGQPTNKTVEGKHFRWCTYHDNKGSGGKWVTHTLADCKVQLALKAKKLGQPSGGLPAKMKVAARTRFPQSSDS
jgi:hypothetical protein